MNKVETYNRKNILSQIKWLIKMVRYLLGKETSGGGGIQSIQEGANIFIDNTDPQNPVVSSTGGIESVTGDLVDNTDPLNPIVNTPDLSGYIKEPVTDGTSGQVLTTDGSGGRSWTTVSGIQSIVPGDNITVDNTDPQNPIISSTDGGGNLTLEQARQNGNVLEGDVVIENFSSEQNETGFISEGGSSKIVFTEEDGVLIDKLQANTNSYINVYSNYASLGINDYALENQISIEASYINNEPSILISTSGKEESKGLIGSKEFNKQGDRKAYVQMGDIEDFYKTIPGYDEEATQTLKHVNGVLQWVIDK